MIRLLVLAAAPTFAQPFVIESFTVNDGGGTSTGGNFTLSGTIGQPDAGTATLSGGTFKLQGGFWPETIIILIVGGPSLKIEPLGSEVRLSWAPATENFVLQQADALTPDSWSAAPGGAQNPVTLPAAETTRFFRLVRP